MKLAPERFLRWKMERVRCIGRDTYIRFTPNLGFGFRLGKNRRVRWAVHHGLQLVTWQPGRGTTIRQLLGRSTVKGDPYASVR